MTKQLSALGVAGLLAGYRAQKFTPVDVARDCLKQALKYNPVYNALCHIDEKSALDQARAAARRWKQGRPKGPLDGIPVTVKDWYDVKGWPTRYGSKTSSAAPREEDALPVARLREAGAVLLGKTTLPEFGHKGVTDSALCGITRNPWNLAKTPGGSSGGAAVAAAVGIAPLNIGSDAGGSIRIPASFTGVVGFKPSPGLVPSWPPSVFASLSSVGSLTRSVADAAHMLDVMMGPDPSDWNAVPYAPPCLVEALGRRLPRLRVAWAPVINGVRAYRDARPVFARHVGLLSVLGAVDEIKLDCPPMVETFLAHWKAIASAHVAGMTAAERKKVDPHYLHWARLGDRMHMHDYIEAERVRMHIGAYFKSLLDTYDVIITPATPMTAFDLGMDMACDENGKEITDIWTVFTPPANLARLPAVSIPLGLTAQGMPVGLQVMGRYLDDARVLQVAQKLERAIGFRGWLEGTASAGLGPAAAGSAVAAARLVGRQKRG